MPQNDLFPSTPDRFDLDDVLTCREHRERVESSLLSGDWGWVDDLPEPGERKAA